MHYDRAYRICRCGCVIMMRRWFLFWICAHTQVVCVNDVIRSFGRKVEVQSIYARLLKSFPCKILLGKSD